MTSLRKKLTICAVSAVVCVAGFVGFSGATASAATAASITVGPSSYSQSIRIHGTDGSYNGCFIRYWRTGYGYGFVYNVYGTFDYTIHGQGSGAINHAQLYCGNARLVASDTGTSSK